MRRTISRERNFNPLDGGRQFTQIQLLWFWSIPFCSLKSSVISYFGWANIFQRLLFPKWQSYISSILLNQILNNLIHSPIFTHTTANTPGEAASVNIEKTVKAQHEF